MDDYMIEYRETHKRCRFCYYLDTITVPGPIGEETTYRCCLKDIPIRLDESLFGLEGFLCKWYYPAEGWKYEN